MKFRAFTFSKSLRKVTLLMAVYALHLTFFQLLMVEPVHASESHFKPLFIHNEKSKPVTPPNHPAVSYYTVLVKQGFTGLRSCCQVNATEADFKPLEIAPVISTSQFLLYPVHILSHLGADSFKLYRLLRVFLI